MKAMYINAPGEVEIKEIEKRRRSIIKTFIWRNLWK